jgi:nucleoside-diphosphate-sugar epimerase
MNSTGNIGLVSGASGYVGGRVANAFARRGWEPRELTRRPQPRKKAVQFQLGEDIAPSSLAGARALVHCAYDFKPLHWAEIQRVNVAGTEKLLRAARAAGVQQLVYLSSISAFEDCRSLYGRAKLETEAVARDFGAVVIRPGLIWSERPGAIFGKLVSQVERGRVLPLFGGGRQIQYLLHDDDLANFIVDCCEEKIQPANEPLTLAHEQSWTFRQILEEIARARGKRLAFFPLPWRLVWAGIRSAELAGLRLDFRSDSLVSLMHQNPSPSFAGQRKLGVACRPFKFAPAK